jgi:hypothetical protein
MSAFHMKILLVARQSFRTSRFRDFCSFACLSDSHD